MRLRQHQPRLHPAQPRRQDHALGGFLTNCCVESTMRTGYEKGYEVVTLTDCTAALSEEEQKLATEKNYPMFSKPMKHGEFLDTLAGSAAAKDLSRGYAVVCGLSSSAFRAKAQERPAYLGAARLTIASLSTLRGKAP